MRADVGAHPAPLDGRVAQDIGHRPDRDAGQAGAAAPRELVPRRVAEQLDEAGAGPIAVRRRVGVERQADEPLRRRPGSARAHAVSPRSASFLTRELPTSAVSRRASAAAVCRPSVVSR